MAKKVRRGGEKNPAVLASDRLISALNRQVGNEMHASLQYVSIGAHFDSANLPELAAFFYRQAEEERDHALKFVKFVVDVGGRLEIPPIASPRAQFGSAAEAVRLSLDWERTVTEQIYALVDVARDDRNYIAQKFLDWFVTEQLEEVTTMDELLAVVERAGEQLIFVEDFLARRPLTAPGGGTAGGE
jgi:ferritin